MLTLLARWNDFSLLTKIIVGAVIIIAAALGTMAVLGGKAIVGLTILPFVVGRFVVDVWIEDQIQKKRILNAVAARRWAHRVFFGVVTLFLIGLIMWAVRHP